MTKEKKKKILAIMSVSYPNFKIEDKALAVEVWSTVLADMTYSQVEMALYCYMRDNTSGFAPSPAHLIEYIDHANNKGMSENEAWNEVANAIRNSSYNASSEFEKLSPITQKVVGSPNELRRMATSENFNLEVEKSLFVRSFRNYQEREKTERKINNFNNELMLEEKEILEIE